MTDVNHTVSKALVDRYGSDTLFVVEDLTGIRNATKKANRNKIKHLFSCRNSDYSSNDDRI